MDQISSHWWNKALKRFIRGLKMLILTWESMGSYSLSAPLVSGGTATLCFHLDKQSWGKCTKFCVDFPKNTTRAGSRSGACSVKLCIDRTLIRPCCPPPSGHSWWASVLLSWPAIQFLLWKAAESWQQQTNRSKEHFVSVLGGGGHGIQPIREQMLQESQLAAGHVYPFMQRYLASNISERRRRRIQTGQWAVNLNPPKK